MFLKYRKSNFGRKIKQVNAAEMQVVLLAGFRMMISLFRQNSADNFWFDDFIDVKGQLELKVPVLNLAALTPEKIAAMNEIYQHYIKKEVQHLW